MASSSGKKAFKSGVWYTLANFITKSIAFITTPIFSRILSHGEYGLFSNFTSWLGTITVFATLNLGTTFISARYDYEESFDEYVSSMVVLSTFLTVIWAVVVNVFSLSFTELTGIEINHLNTMFIYLIFFSAVEMFQTKERYFYNYKKTVIISLGIAILTALLSVILVRMMNNHLQGRILGYVLPTIIIGSFIYFKLIKQGKRICFKYWKYAIPICLPYIPHALSLYLLNSMDKMMITQICGPEQNALYSIAYSCGAIITLLGTAINTAFAPWLAEKLNEEKYSDIYHISKKYVVAYCFMTCGVMLITPEVLLIMGGRSYLEAMYVMPPVTFGCACQFMYSMYVNVEQFKKKTIGMAAATGIAAFCNFILNYIFINIYGYIAAAYTTLASYMILLLIHIFLVTRMKLGKIYPLHYIMGIICFMSIYTIGVNCLYHNSIIRYCLIIMYSLLLIAVIIKYRKMLLVIFKR